jgi:hypothetical protein
MTHHNQTKELTTWFLNGEEGHGGGDGEDCGRSCRDSPAPSHAPSMAGAKKAAAPSGSTPLAKCPYWGVWKPQFVQLPLFFSELHSLITSPFCPAPLPLAWPP